MKTSQVQRSIKQVLLKAYNLKCNKPGKSREEEIYFQEQKSKKRRKKRDLRNCNFKAFTKSSLRINYEYRTKK
jgi:hypothetical protein